MLHTLPNLKLRHLRFLVFLDQDRHLGRAAAHMHMTQPAASRLLAELERGFGQTLFERGRQGVAPLPAGEDALRFAHAVLAEEQVLRDAFRARDTGETTVRIGTLPTIPITLIEAIKACKRRGVPRKLRLHQNTLDMLIPLLRAGELDLVVGRFDAALLSPDLNYVRLAEEPLEVVCGTGHPLARAVHIAPSDLLDWPWVAPPEHSSLHPLFVELFAAAGLPVPDNLIECASPMALHAFVQDQATLGLFNASAWGHTSQEGIHRLPVELPSAPAALGIYQVRRRTASAAVKLMISALRGDIDTAG